jgi:hypothetical protein
MVPQGKIERLRREGRGCVPSLRAALEWLAPGAAFVFLVMLFSLAETCARDFLC